MIVVVSYNGSIVQHMTRWTQFYLCQTDIYFCMKYILKSLNLFANYTKCKLCIWFLYYLTVHKKFICLWQTPNKCAITRSLTHIHEPITFLIPNKNKDKAILIDIYRDILRFLVKKSLKRDIGELGKVIILYCKFIWGRLIKIYYTCQPTCWL